MHSQKTGIAASNFTKSDAAVLSSFACGEIDDGNSVVHGRVAQPSHPMVQRATRLRIGCGSDGRGSNAFLLLIFCYCSFNTNLPNRYPITSHYLLS